MRVTFGLTALAAVFSHPALAQSPVELTRQVQVAESSFAATMVKRNHAAFTSFLADETVFFGRNGAIRGKDSVAAEWKAFFEGDTAPFSWRPEVVEVLNSGTLGLTSGPVFDVGGRRIGTFNSVWRREAGGAWKIIFDKGCPRIAGT